MTSQSTAYSDNVVRGASHTSQEIAQQPQLWRQVGEVVAASRSFVDPLVSRPDLRVVLTGAGTSSFAGEVVAPALRHHLQCRVDAVSTTDIVAAPQDCFGEDVPTLLVSFARSGDSPESVAATELADQLLSEVHHLVLTCNPSGQLAGRYGAHDRAHVALMPDGANDQGFAMTSSFTTMALTALLALVPVVDQDLAARLAGVVDEVMDPWDAMAGRARRT